MMNFSLPSGYDADVSAYRQVFTSAMDRYDVDVAVYLTIRSTVMSHSQALIQLGTAMDGYSAFRRSACHDRANGHRQLRHACGY